MGYAHCTVDLVKGLHTMHSGSQLGIVDVVHCGL